MSAEAASSHLRRYGIGLGVVVIGGSLLFQFGNIVDVNTEELCCVQDLRTGRVRKELLPPGRHYLSYLDYPIHLDSQKEISVVSKFISRDQQSVPVRVITRTSFSEQDVPQLADRYQLQSYQQKINDLIIPEKLSPILQQYTLVEWIEQESEIRTQLTREISEALEKKNLHCEEVLLHYDTQYIRDIFLYFYSEEELQAKPFYSKLYALSATSSFSHSKE